MNGGQMHSTVPGHRHMAALFQDMADIVPEQDREIRSLRLDSRLVELGDLFIAVPGETVDGRNYISQAIERGAAAVVYEQQASHLGFDTDVAIPCIPVQQLQSKISAVAARYHDHPSRNLKVVGVTGTNGKTTFTFLLARALELLGQKCGMMGTVGNGYPGALRKSSLTTDDAIQIQRDLAGFVADDACVVCMEVSSHGLEQDRVNGVEFDIVVFSNLSQDHLDYHGTLERYAAAKKKLFEFPGLYLAVVNYDDELGQEILRSHKADRCISYGLKGGDLQPRDVVLDGQGIEFTISWQGQTQRIQSSLLGEINLPNLLAVIACLLGQGFDLDRIQKTIPLLSAPPGRMEVFSAPGSAKVVVDYSHTPDALERALVSLKQLEQGKLTVVFGCGGDRDQGKRPQMGKIAEQHADKIILTDDNPRSESPAEIVDQILQGMSRQVDVIHDRRQAIKKAIDWSDCEDMVLIAGKGHEETQTTRQGVIPLSDREIVREILEMTT